MREVSGAGRVACARRACRPRGRDRRTWSRMAAGSGADASAGGLGGSARTSVDRRVRCGARAGGRRSAHGRRRRRRGRRRRTRLASRPRGSPGARGSSPGGSRTGRAPVIGAMQVVLGGSAGRSGIAAGERRRALRTATAARRCRRAATWGGTFLPKPISIDRNNFKHLPYGSFHHRALAGRRYQFGGAPA